MYDLRVDGLRDLARRTLFKTRKQSRDPMSGVVDGSNRTFYSTYYPIASSGSFQFHYSSGSSVGLSATIDYDTGCVVFDSAPSGQPLATYTYSELTDDEKVDLLMAGFDEMQTRWNRPFYLSSSSSSFVQADGTESHIYVVTKSGSAVSDPVCSGIAFSTLRVQVGFFVLCTEYAYLRNRAQHLATTAFRFTEQRGPTVDQSRMPANVDQALERLERRLDKALEIAQAQYGVSYGAYISPVMTSEFEEIYLWQEEARDQDRTTS